MLQWFSMISRSSFCKMSISIIYTLEGVCTGWDSIIFTTEGVAWSCPVFQLKFQVRCIFPHMYSTVAQKIIIPLSTRTILRALDAWWWKTTATRGGSVRLGNDPVHHRPDSFFRATLQRMTTENKPLTFHSLSIEYNRKIYESRISLLVTHIVLMWSFWTISFRH